MAEQPDKLAGRATLVNALGLHARSAARIAEMALRARGAVRIKKGSHAADATSVIDMLTLACPPGTVLEFAIEDPADYDILKALLELVNGGFKE